MNDINIRLAFTNTGQGSDGGASELRSAMEFADQVATEVEAFAPTICNTTKPRHHLDRALLAIWGIQRALATPNKGTDKAWGVEREIRRMREAATDWRRPALRQVEGPNDLKIYGGTIADDIEKWAGMIESLATAPKAGNDGEVERLRDAAQEVRHSLHALRMGHRVDITATVERLDAALSPSPADSGEDRA